MSKFYFIAAFVVVIGSAVLMAALSKNTPTQDHTVVQNTVVLHDAFAAKYSSTPSGVTPGSNRVVIQPTDSGETWMWDTEPEEQVGSFASLLFVREPFRHVVRR